MQMRFVLPLACAACVALAATVGCSKVATSVGGSDQAHSWTQPGVLRLSDISDPSSLNPMLTGADVAYEVASYALEYLVQLDDRGDLVPVLCEQIPTLENGGVRQVGAGMDVAYQLRPGLRWSDGQPLTSDDAVFTYQTITGPAAQSAISSISSDAASLEKLSLT